MDRPVGFALVGASSVAQAHGRVLRAGPGSRLLWVCSRDPARARALGGALGVRWTTQYEQALEDPGVEAVDIVTEPRRHAALGMEAAARGKHLLVEKPVDDDLEAAEALAAAARRQGVCASVVAPKRFDPVLQLMRQRMEVIRPVISAQATMLLHRGLSYYAQPPGWRADYGHVLLNQGIHWLDVFTWFLGAPLDVRAVSARHRPALACADTAMVQARHQDGGLSALTASTACDRNYPETFQLIGARGRLSYEDIARQWRLARAGRAARARLHSWLRRGAMAPWPFLLEAQVADVVESIRTNRAPRVSLQDGCEALRFVKRCEEAALEAGAAA